MKNLLKMLMVMLAAAALMQLYRANMELKYYSEALTGQLESEDAQLRACIVGAYARTHQDAQKIAELEAKLQTSTADKGLTN